MGEKRRVSALIDAAAARMQEMESQGFDARSDGFLEPGKDGRCSYDEIAEGVLLAAVREHEERKVPLLGNLIAELVYGREAEQVGRADANAILALAKRLTYRQLCLIALFGLAPSQHGERTFKFYAQELPKVPALFNPHELSEPELFESLESEQGLGAAATYQELLELESLRLVSLMEGSGRNLMMYRLSGLSLALYEMMRLFLIATDELAEVSTTLQAGP